MKRYFRIAIFLMVLCLLMIVGKNNIGYAEESKPLRTEVIIDYDLEDVTGSLIPTVRVSMFNYTDNSLKKEKYTYPELAIKKTSIGNDFAGYKDYAIINNKAYWSVTNDLIPLAEGNYARLYEFDMNTKKLQVIKQVRAEHTPRVITLYPNFKGYSISPDRDPLDDKNHLKNNIEIYTLPNNKLLQKVSSVIGEGSQKRNNWSSFYITLPKPTNLLVNLINKISSEPSRQHSAFWLSLKGKDGHVGKEFATYKIGKDYYVEQGFELSHEGNKTDVELSFDVSIDIVRWKYIYFSRPFTHKIGDIRYSLYYDAKIGTDVIGYTTNGENYTLYTGAGVRPKATFSPNNKYLIITTYEFNPKTGMNTGKYNTLIIDTATAKVIQKLPVYDSKGLDHTYEWDYGDELARVYFFDRIKSGYLNVSTGIFVNQDSGKSSSSATRYEANYEEYLSPEISRQLLYDGNEVPISGQGPFLSKSGVWYVPMDDFAKGVGVIVTEGGGALKITKGDINGSIPANSIIRFKNRVYAPFDELKRILNLKVMLKNRS